MRINDLLIESTNQLDEGPKFNKFGQAVGNVAGMAAKGIGAVAGGIAGLGAAAKKGFQAGKSQVAAADDGTTTGKPVAKKAAAGATGTAPAGGAIGAMAGQLAKGGAATAKPGAGGGGTATKPKGFIAGVKAGQSQGLSALNDPNVIGSSSSGAAAGAEDPPAGGATTPPSATDINKAGPKGTAQAKPIQGTVAKQAAAKTGAALAGQDQAQAGQTMYSQVKANIDKLDKKGKQRILQLLQKSMAAPAGGAAPATGKSLPNTMANAPVSKTNTAKPGNPNAAPAGNYDGKTGAPLSDKAKADAAFDASPEGKAQQAKVDAMGTAPAGKKPVRVRGKKAAQAVPQQQMASKINTGSMVLEGFSLFRKK